MVRHIPGGGCGWRACAPCDIPPPPAKPRVENNTLVGEELLALPVEPGTSVVLRGLAEMVLGVFFKVVGHGYTTPAAGER